MKIILGIIISVLFTINVFGQVDDEYKESEYRDQTNMDTIFKKDARSDPSKKVYDPTAKTDPVNTIKIGNLEIMKNDLLLFGEFDNMNFVKAKELCNSLGNGWRIPNRNELLLIYHNWKKISGFKGVEYWYAENETTKCGMKTMFDIWLNHDDKNMDSNFYTSTAYGCQFEEDENGHRIYVAQDAHVRAVRTIK